MKFSIIVPVYNIKDYLETCMNSLLRQDYLDYEILLIDDGATDGSGELCDQYQNDTRVRVFHKPNGGLSDARNYGIERATGDYLVFVDSDDWITDNALSSFAEVLQQGYADVLITRLVEVFVDDGQQIYKDASFEEYLKDGTLTKERAIEWICNRSQSTFPSVKYIVSRTFVEKYNLRFIKGRLHEDMDWTSNLCYLAESFSGCINAWYFHRMNRVGAITASFNSKHSIDMIEMASLQYQKMQIHNDSIHRIVMNRFMGSVYAWLRYTKSLSNDELKKIAKVMDDNKEVFSVAPQLKHKIFCTIYKTFGGVVALKSLRVF